RLGAVCNSLSLAVSAFPRHRVDVSCRLRSCRHSHVARGRAGRPRHGPANHRVRGDARAREFAADSSGGVRKNLSRRRANSRPALSREQHPRGAFEIEPARAPIAAGFSALLAIVVRCDGSKSLSAKGKALKSRTDSLCALPLARTKETTDGTPSGNSNLADHNSV